MKKRWFLNKKILIITFLLAINIAFLILYKNRSITTAILQNTSYPEIEEVASKTMTFKELSVYFKKLAETKTAEYAFNVLKRASLPPQTDVHLLAHVVGDELYKQKKIKGIEICTDDFRNACSHSIVIGAYLEKGEAAFPEIADTCRKAPGNKGAYAMCFHGVGHGVLAAAKYKLENAAKVCQKLGTKEYNDREAIECVGGAVMEMMAGVHNVDEWNKEKGNYISKSDPLSPCNKDYIPENAKNHCYIYLTPNLLKSAGATAREPQPEYFESAMKFCLGIPQDNASNRNACIGAFGKEFPAMLASKDIENLDKLTDEQMQTVFEWCSFSPTQDGEHSCTMFALSSLFWGGENDPAIAIRYCSNAPDSSTKRKCFDTLTNLAKTSLINKTAYSSFCTKLPSFYQEQCIKKS